MAYTWTDGEIITADKLNTLEGRIGFDVGEEVLFEEEVTTTQQSGVPFAMGNIAYSYFIDANVLNVIFNGIEYSLKKTTINGFNSYGELDEQGMPVFDTCPLGIISMGVNTNKLATSEPGTYNIKVKAQSVETTAIFEQAVKKFGVKNIKDGEGERSVIEGENTTASGVNSHAEGYETTASELCSHAEGQNTTASGYVSHAEGQNTTASGNTSHTEGTRTIASKENSHAEGDWTTASGNDAHAQNKGTIAQGLSQTAIGEYNIAQGKSTSRSDTDYAFIIGNGTSVNRSNALAIKWDGTFVFADGTEITPAQFASLKALLNS